MVECLFFCKVSSVDKLSADENEMKKYVYNKGTLGAAVNGNFLQLYKKGIYDDSKNCNLRMLNHFVIIVGYGQDEVSNFDYWICKNSWGEDGFFRISRGKGTCGINRYVLGANFEILK